jgi:hypothetical protein
LSLEPVHPAFWNHDKGYYTIPNPEPSPAFKYTKRVTPGTHLDLAYPSVKRGIAGYTFAVGDDFRNPPEYVQLVITTGRGPFVNTGRKLMWRFTIVFDAVGGRFGFGASSGFRP